jgi:hypothetical protein
MTAERPFAALATDVIPNLVVAGGFGCTTHVFPFYAKAERYHDPTISKRDILHYFYAVLPPEYRERYAANRLVFRS